MTVREYLEERVLYGGATMTRGEVIADLQRWAADAPNPEAAVSAYLAGLDRRMERVTEGELERGEKIAAWLVKESQRREEA